jgi:predicted nuclease of restriction endonuclease-like (RecB) superfamily
LLPAWLSASGLRQGNSNPILCKGQQQAPLFLHPKSSPLLVKKIEAQLLKNHAQSPRLLPQTAWEVGALLSELTANDLANVCTALKAAGCPCRTAQLRQMMLIFRAFPHKSDLSHRLSVTHHVLIARLPDLARRSFYLLAAEAGQWSTAELRRQIKARYYERCSSAVLPVSPHYVLEFAGDAPIATEAQLEGKLLQRIQDFLLELGAGFAFVARQKQIRTGSGRRFFVDLVFYHTHLKCYVLVELKTGALSHRDIGQLDFYVRYFDEHFRQPEDKPTIGLLLVRQQDQTLLRYSMLNQSEQLWSATYQLHLPSEAELAAVLESYFSNQKTT